MKKYHKKCVHVGLSLFMLFLLNVNVKAQINTSMAYKGWFNRLLFLNAKYNVVSENVSLKLNRRHFVLRYNLSENLYFNGVESAKEVYKPVKDSLGSEYNQITNLFEFCLGFQFEKLGGKFRRNDAELNQQQEKLWQNRAIDKVFADKYRFSVISHQCG